jgi:hypothetical protein
MAFFRRFRAQRRLTGMARGEVLRQSALLAAVRNEVEREHEPYLDALEGVPGMRPRCRDHAQRAVYFPTATSTRV